MIASYSMVYSQFIAVVFLFWAVLTAADPEAKLLNSGCSTVKSTNVTLFKNNLNAVLEALGAKIVSSGFATAEQVIGTDPVYGLAQCRKDKTPSDCLKCITVAEKQIRNCSAVSGGRVIYDGCFLRYESNNFYAQATGPGNTQFCGATKASGVSNQFSETAQNLIGDLITAAPKSAGLFAAHTSQGPSNSTIYALASCLRSINESGCSECLGIAEGNIRNCLPQTEGRAVDVGCYLRYATYPFFPSNATTDLKALLSSGHKNKSRTWIIIVGVVGGVAVILIMTLIARHYFFRLYTIPSQQRQVDTLVATELRGPVDFDFKILRDATNKFDTANKIGEGGFGEVYKGTLRNGKVIAVKKLSLVQTARAISEFEGEVKLISNVHHRNLVRLLGCCNQGPERLLVYEYMPNSSLDRVLFGEGRQSLSWETRFAIILGTARGLSYLHEDFHVRIIHRDIKSSNILLDENFGPKIADFGLARLLPEDRSHLSTRVAGTLGYTAPEYAVHGQLTEKADTYSYGVVVLEIVSGRKSIDMKQPPHMQYLLEWVWKLYETNEVLEMVDETMGDEYDKEEVLRMIQLGLLCTQASVAQRPSMSEIVAMLVSKRDINNLQTTPMKPALGYTVRTTNSESGTSSSTSNATVSTSLTAR
eukprot:PITA_22494